MSLVRFWSSLPKMEKLSIVTEWPEMLIWSCMGEGALRCSLNLSSKFLADCPMYSWSQSTLPHLYLYMTPLLLRIGSLSLGVMKIFDGMTSLQMYFNPIFSASSVEALTQPLMVRDHNMCFWPSVVWSWLLAVLIVFLLGWCLALYLHSVWLYCSMVTLDNFGHYISHHWQ